MIKKIKDFTKSEFIRNLIETFATQGFLLLIGLISSIIIARALGPTNRGIYATAIAISAIGIQFGNLGLFASNVYYVTKKPQILNNLISNTLFVSFAIMGTLSAMAMIVFILDKNLFHLPINLLILAFIWIPFGIAYLLFQNLLLGINKVRAYNLIDIVTKGIYLVLLIILIITNSTNITLFFALNIITLALAFFLAYFILRGGLKKPAPVSLSLLKSHLSYGAKAYLSSLFAYLVLKVDLLMVKQWLGPTETGYYSIAVGMADIVYLIPVTIGTLLFPKLTAQEDEEYKWLLAKKVIFNLSLIMIAASVLAALFASPIIKILYGAEYLPAVPAFIWLLPAIILMAINVIFMNFFASVGMPPITVYSPAVASLVNIISNIYLLPKYGIVGASISSLIAYGIMLCFSLNYVFSRRKNARLSDKTL